MAGKEMEPMHEMAIDPVAFVLHGEALYYYYLIHHPNVPLVEKIQAAAKKMTKEQKNAAYQRAKIINEVSKTVMAGFQQ